MIPALKATLDLRDLSNAPLTTEVNRAVAHYVCGWSEQLISAYVTQGGWTERHWASSADAVMSLLRQQPTVTIQLNPDNHVTIRSEPPYSSRPSRTLGEAVGPTLPLAACIALLRAHGVEVLT